MAFGERGGSYVTYRAGADDDHGEEPDCPTPAHPDRWHPLCASLRQCRTPRTTTTIINCLSMLFERTDEVVLPAIYKFVAASFNASLTELGYLTLARSLSQALLSPLGGILGHLYNRAWVVSAGCLVWGATTTAFSFTGSVAQGIATWAITGLGLCLVIPNVQSLTADYYEEQDRGKAFGVLYLTSAGGAALGTLWATNVGGMRFGGWEGWRLAILLLGIASCLVGVLNWALARDPRCPGNRLHQQARPSSTLKAGPWPSVGKEIGGVLVIPTFVIIILQGIVGNIPGTALGFVTLYVQLLGLSDLAAGVMVALGMAANAVGGLLGGWLGDLASRASPNHGRILVCQISIVASALTVLVVLKGLPLEDAGSHAWQYTLCFVVYGLLSAWPAPATNNPIFAEIVPGRLRNIVYAFDRSFEMAIAAAVSPLVGVIAEKYFGFDGSATTSGDPKQDRANAASLGNAVLVMTMLPWSLCVLTYTAVHFTYRRDKLRALALSQGEQQTVLVWAGSPGGSPGRSPVMPERDWRDGEGDVASDAALETVSMLGGSKLSHA